MDTFDCKRRVMHLLETTVCSFVLISKISMDNWKIIFKWKKWLGSLYYKKLVTINIF